MATKNFRLEEKRKALKKRRKSGQAGKDPPESEKGKQPSVEVLNNINVM